MNSVLLYPTLNCMARRRTLVPLTKGRRRARSMSKTSRVRSKCTRVTTKRKSTRVKHCKPTRMLPKTNRRCGGMDDDIEEDDIEKRKDPNTGATYYYNTRTEKAGWTIEEVTDNSITTEEVTDNSMMRLELYGDTYTIEKRIDPSSKKTYYYNHQTEQSYWTRLEALTKTLQKATEGHAEEDEGAGAAAAPVAEPREPVGQTEFDCKFLEGRLGMDVGIKLVVQNIRENGAAASQMVKKGDIVQEINNVRISNMSHSSINTALKQRPLSLKLLRQGGGAAAGNN